MNKGTLYIVATPIGNLDEVSFRTIDTLKKVSLIACEDTRNSRKLLSKYDIHNKLVAYHNFNEEESASHLIDILNEGKDVAVVSDAGYPLVSDPGYELVKKAIENSIRIETISGPNAALNALVGSGLDTNHYFFYGFLDSKASKAKTELNEVKDLPYTIIFYEAPHRINKTINLMLEVLGDRKVVIARELTKLHEQFLRGKLSDFKDIDVKGEIVIVLEGKKEEKEEVDIDLCIKDMDKLIKKGLKTKDAAKEVSLKYGLSKNVLYNNYLKEKK